MVEKDLVFLRNTGLVEFDCKDASSQEGNVCRAEKASARVVRVFDLLRHKFARHSMNPVTLVLGGLKYHSDLTSTDAYANENGGKA